MHPRNPFWRRLYSAASAVVYWLVLSTEAWAQQPVQEEGGGSASYVLPYFLVIFSVGLGMMVVLRSARRSERAKPKQYGE